METLKWWQKAVFYQIYPRSFADGNGDGIGDFKGMTARLDYVHDLGVDAIWLSPHYPSPFLDCGYDVSDYTAVGPEYGSLDGFKRFLDKAHRRNIRIVLDLVLNHTSDQHLWFIESRSSLDNPKRDWYIWRDPARGGGAPNNWNSIFGGSAWELDTTTGQYYYHAFLKEQPDLNWHNPEVKQAMWDAVRFWLDMGVDGFRLDAVATIFEHPDLPDHTATMSSADLAAAAVTATTDADHRRLFDEYGKLLRYQTQQAGTHELMQELRTVVDEYPGDRVLIGEDEDFAYHGSGDDELHLVFNFPMMRAGRLTPDHIRTNQTERLAALPPGAWPCNTLGNHDTPRVWSRYGDGVHDAELARLHLALVLLLKGTPFLYNGEEIGMTDLELTDLAQFRDTIAISHFRLMTEQLGIPANEALKRVALSTRDRCRSPMQWSCAPNGGFSPPGVTTWLPVNPNYATGVNVASQEGDPNSLLNFYRRMLRLRRSTPALIAGDYRPLDPPSDSYGTPANRRARAARRSAGTIRMARSAYLAFLRHDVTTDQTCLVALNFSDHIERLSLELADHAATLLFSCHERADQPLQINPLDLAPFEILVAELT